MATKAQLEERVAELEKALEHSVTKDKLESLLQTQEHDMAAIQGAMQMLSWCLENICEGEE